MTQHSKNAADLTTVRGDRDPSVVVACEDVVEDGLRASVLGSRRLGNHAGPQLVILGESWLDLEAGEQVLNVCLVAAVVASVS